MFPNILWAYELHKSNVNSAYKFKFGTTGMLRVSMAESLPVFTRKNLLENKIGSSTRPVAPLLTWENVREFFHHWKHFRVCGLREKHSQPS